MIGADQLILMFGTIGQTMLCTGPDLINIWKPLFPVPEGPMAPPPLHNSGDGVSGGCELPPAFPWSDMALLDRFSSGLIVAPPPTAAAFAVEAAAAAAAEALAATAAATAPA